MAAPASAATIPAAALPPARLVAEGPAVLVELGCQRIDTATDAVTAPPAHPYHAIPQGDPTLHYLCPIAAAASLTAVDGQVAGLINPASAQGLGDARRLIPDLPAAFNAARQGDFSGALSQGTVGGRAANLAKEKAETAAYSAITQLLTVISFFGALLAIYAGTILGLIISQGSFVTSDVVRLGWPIVLGITNLGFILALLYIAFATTLQLDLPGGLRRTLPKLLIAALLVNFSLVIGGIILDASRLGMATMTALLGVGSPNEIGIKLLSSSKLIGTTINLNTSGGAAGNVALLGVDVSAQASAEANAYADAVTSNIGRIAGIVGTDANQTVTAALAAALIWGYALALSFITVAFFVRYVILLLLLIVSPVAFLALPFPNLGNITEKWWTNFLKWTIYGPVALFIIVLAASLDRFPIVGDRLAGSAFGNIATTVLLMVLLIMAIIASKFIGGVGGVAAFNFAKGGFDRAGQGLRRGAAAGVGAATYVPRKAAGAVKTGVEKNISDSVAGGTGKVIENLAARAGLSTKPAKKQAEEFVEGRLGPSRNPKQRQQTAEAKQDIAAINSGPTASADQLELVNNARRDFPELDKKLFPRSADSAELTNNINNIGSSDLKNAISSNPDLGDALNAYFDVQSQIRSADGLRLDKLASPALGTDLAASPENEIEVVLQYGGTRIENSIMNNPEVSSAIAKKDALNKRVLDGDFGENVLDKHLRNLRRIAERESRSK